MLSRFHYRRVTDGRTDGQTELLYQYRVSVLTRDKKQLKYKKKHRDNAGIEIIVRKKLYTLEIILLPIYSVLISKYYKKFSCRREAARCLVSLNIALSHSSQGHSRSREMTVRDTLENHG